MHGSQRGMGLAEPPHPVRQSPQMRHGNVRLLAALAWLALVTGSTEASAVPNPRTQLVQRGDFVLIGNTLAHECDSPTPAPVFGAFDCTTMNGGDAAPDIYWRSDSPAINEAEANPLITPAQARSTAMLTLPAGAVVTHAFLYWGAERSMSGFDPDVTLEREGAFSAVVNAAQGFTLQGMMPVTFFYQSFADVTETVKTHGGGAYRVSGVDAIDLADQLNNDTYAGWWMIVFYELATEPLRHLALFDGLSPVNTTTEQQATVGGFLTANAAIDAKLGVVAFEGDNTITGDSLYVNDMTPLTDGLNVSDNFFNGTRSLFGAPVSVSGDLPQLAGTPRSMSGIELDIIDIAPKLPPAAANLTIKASSTNDQIFLAGLVTSIVTVADQCADDMDCAPSKPACDTAPSPNVCVGCLSGAHCPGEAPTCDAATQTCICVPKGSESCNGLDDNCDGVIDEGKPGGGLACSTDLLGVCAAGATACVSGKVICAPVIEPGSQAEVCGNPVDEDCDGELECQAGASTGGGAGAGGDGGGGETVFYDGCICGVRPRSVTRDLGWISLFSAGALAARRRRRPE
jgi:hypothetical protein